MTDSLVALVGNPNCGKTALFNTLTGLRNKVANYPGVTVEVVKSELSKSYGGNCVLIDLPGTYSLSPVSDDEAITSDFLCGAPGQLKPQLIINVLDATQLELGLGLTLDLLRLETPVLVALNMMDLAESSGAVINVDTLARELGVPVVPISATKKWGLNKLSNAIESCISTPQTSKVLDWNDLSSKGDLVHKIALSCTETKGRRSELTARVDKYVLHPVFGPLILLAALALIFQAVFAWAAFPMDLIESFIGKIAELLSTAMPQGLLRDLLVDGIIGGVGSVIVFLPQIVILFSFILFLEDFGYMARASYLMDRIMGTVGLSGKAVIPLVSGLACAVPSILATRSIPSKRDRLLTMMLAPLMTCSARLPVYALLIAAFIPANQFLGMNRQGVVMLLLYVGGVFAVLGVGFVLKATVLPGEAQPLLIELPRYKWPSLKLLGIAILDRARMFLKRAGTFILAVSIVMWAVTTFPRKPEDRAGTDIEYSIAGRLGTVIEPILRPLGFNYEISVALIPGFAAREVMVSALGTVYAIGGESEESKGANLTTFVQETWAPSTAYALLAWYIFSPQCLATFAVLGRESRSWRKTSGIFVFYLALAWLAAFAVFTISSWMLS